MINLDYLRGQRVTVPLSPLDFRTGTIVNVHTCNDTGDHYEIEVEIPVNSSIPTTITQMYDISCLVIDKELDEILQELIGNPNVEDITIQ